MAIKIFIAAHSAETCTGIGNTVRSIFRPLLEKYPGKYEIQQLGYFHPGTREFNIPWPIYPTKVVQSPQGPQLDMNDKYGEISFNELVHKIKPDIVFGYGDMWHFDHMLNSPLRNTYRMVSYYTIDGQPYYGTLAPDGSTDWGKKLLKTDKLIVLSHFGVKTLKESCPELKDIDIEVRYHPLDMSKHKFLSPKDKEEFKKKVLPPIIANNSFIIGWCGRNQFRKQNYKLWEILHYMIFGDYIECKQCNRITVKEFNHSTRKIRALGELTLYDYDYDYSHCWHCKSSNIVPGVPQDNTYMWFHMPKTDNFYTPDFHERMWNVGNKCIYTNGLDQVKGIPEQAVYDIMSTWDCHLYPSGGEGLGNPLIESMASGIPVVYSNYSSHAEMGQFGGLPIRVTYISEPHIGIQRSIVDTNHAVEQLLKLYRDPKLKYDLGLRGRQHVSQYTLDTMAPTWDKVFTEMMRRPLPQAGNKLYSTVI